MSFLDWLTFRPRDLELAELAELETRELSDLPVDEQLARIWQQRGGIIGPPSVRTAMGIPAVFRSVSLIANLTASLPIDTYRLGELIDPADAPPIVRRPDPFNTPRSFLRNTATALAQYGEAVWWIAQRDTDGLPSSLVNLHPPEVRIEWDERRFRPVFTWRERDITSECQHITLLRFGDSPRGVGPLQVCGSVMTAATEAAEWSARFMASGGVPSVVLNYPGTLTAQEAATLKADWTSSPSNMPKVTSGGLTASAFQVSPRDAQLIDVREQSVADIARMFGLPAYLLNTEAGGSGLTYANVGNIATELLRLTLVPNYLAAIEQAITDLLPRTLAVRFRVEAIERADIETRFAVYASGIASGVLTVEQAQALEFDGDIYSPPNRREISDRKVPAV